MPSRNAKTTFARTEPIPTITLTTDFGLRDWFVGTMQGVIAGIHPAAKVVDLTHDIPAGDVRAGAFALAAAYSYFPKDTIHVAVVDPGVGSARRAIAGQTAKYFFVGPDNGLLSWALARQKILACHALQNQTFFLPSVSRTFHGRDIFAPVAAHLSRGVPIQKLGPPVKEFLRLDRPEPERSGRRLKGQILYIDRFGNAITNCDAFALSPLGQGRLHVLARGKKLCSVEGFYQAVGSGQAVAVLGSTGFLEIAINGGNAAARFSLRAGDPVTISP